MRATNLYVLTRNVESSIRPQYEKCISSREDALHIRDGELSVIRDVLDTLIQMQISFQYLDNWFYSFTIPQISKEFDLVKIGKNNIVLNIEVKEQEVERAKIYRQLFQNRYYLSNLSKAVFCYACVRNHSGGIDIYKLAGDKLEPTSFEELKSKMQLISDAVDSNIEDLFRPRDYLISPINTPERFLNDEYFLNDHQREIKNRILHGLSTDRRLWGISGSAGTGKTLLLYDIAKTLGTQNKVCIIHSGILSVGHDRLKSQIENVNIIGAKGARREYLCQFDYICVDESHRLYKEVIDNILELLDAGIIEGSVFAYDYAQCLSRNELKRNNPNRLRLTNGFMEEKLTEKIRTNEKLISYIRTLLRNRDVPRKPVKYDCVDVLYANSEDEADIILEIYKNKGYKFITFTPSNYVRNDIDHYAANENSHQVIGQEFDDVVLLLDNNFQYSKEGELEGRVHPNPDYLFPRLFYQNITRARERLCIIVLNNPDVFERLLQIKDNTIMDNVFRTG